MWIGLLVGSWVSGTFDYSVLLFTYFSEEREKRQIAMERKGEHSEFPYPFPPYSTYHTYSSMSYLFHCRVILGMAGS